MAASTVARRRLLSWWSPVIGSMLRVSGWHLRRGRKRLKRSSSKTVGVDDGHGESAPTAAGCGLNAERSGGLVRDHRRTLHLNDDAVTGVGYHRWFKRVVPTDANAFQANARLDLDPDDVGARRIIGRAAHNAERNRSACTTKKRSVDSRRMTTHGSVWRGRNAGLDITRRRRSCIERYFGAAQHPLALGGLSMAAARLGRMDDAQDILDTLHVPRRATLTRTSPRPSSSRFAATRAMPRSLRRVLQRRDLLDEVSG